jgi:ATP-dependent DNA helicase RecG
LLSDALTVLKGVGPALTKKLEKLGLHRVEDLLFLLPLRYEDRTQLVKIGALVAGARCLVSGEVLLAETAYRGRRNLLVRVSDGSGQLTLRFFHFSRQQQAQFQNGAHVTCFGEVRRGSAGFEMIHPEYRVLREDLPGNGRRATGEGAQPDRPGPASHARRSACRVTA